MSLESDAAGPRGAQPDSVENDIQMASLGTSPADFNAFYVPTNNSLSQNNHFHSSLSGFNQTQQTSFSPYDRYNSSYQFDRFNPPRNNRPSGYPPNHSRDPWQQYRFDAYGPGQFQTGPNQFGPNQMNDFGPYQQQGPQGPWHGQWDGPQGPYQSPNQGDFWGQYWSNYFREAERRGYRPPRQDGPRPPGDRRYPPTDRPDQPAAPFQRTGSRMPMEQVTDASIVNDISRRRNGERVDPVYVGIDNRESYRGQDGRKHIRTAPAWLDRPAAMAYLMINEELARSGKRLMPASHCADCANINSLGRTNTQQAIATGLAARPGNSEHERGAALDVKNHTDPEVHRLLLAYGFVQGNLSRPNVPIRNDAHHYSFDIRNATRIAQMFERSEVGRRIAAANQNGPRQAHTRQDGPDRNIPRQVQYDPDMRQDPRRRQFPQRYAEMDES